MKSTTSLEELLEETTETLQSNDNGHGNGNGNGNGNGRGSLQDSHTKVDLTNKATALRQLVQSLLMEVQALDDLPSLDFRQGIDFYEEVRRFEIALIKHALAETGGHQMRAARLLNMKVTTLNSKIKHYDIRPEKIIGGAYLQENRESAAHDKA